METEHKEKKKNHKKVKNQQKEEKIKYVSAFDAKYPTADGPIPEDQEKELSEDILPQLVFSHLDQNQIEMIKKFREDPEIVEWIYSPSDSHYFHTDFYLSRWLVAREWDFPKAKEMFINAMKWRKENKVDTIVEDFEKSEYFPILAQYWPGSYSREWDFWSFDNSFVTYQSLSSLETSLIKYIPSEVLIRFHIYCSEILELKYNKIVQQKGYFPGCIIVEDLSGLSMGFLDKKILDLLNEVIRLDSDYYPAILRKFYLMNTPKVFAMIWGIVKGFFDKGTLERFEIVSDPKKVGPLLEGCVPKRYIPQYMGGESPWKMPNVGTLKDNLKKLKLQQQQQQKKEGGNVK